MRRGAIRSGAVSLGVLTLGGAGALAAAVPASAAPSCVATVPAATLISSTVCEIRVTADGDVTIPTSVTKVGAVLVGAGGGGFHYVPDSEGYAGDGGAMEYIEFAGDGVPHPVVIGAGGSAGIDTGAISTDGGSTTFNGASAFGGASGVSAGAELGVGANGSAPDVRSGYVLSSLPGVDAALFPVGLDTFEYARGGTGDGNGTPLTTGPAATDYGYGGNGLLDGGTSTDGVDGIVILRFAAVDDTPPVVPPAAPSGPRLPDTGFDATPALIAAGGLLVAGGLAFAVSRRRRGAD